MMARTGQTGLSTTRYRLRPQNTAGHGHARELKREFHQGQRIKFSQKGRIYDSCLHPIQDRKNAKKPLALPAGPYMTNFSHSQAAQAAVGNPLFIGLTDARTRQESLGMTNFSHSQAAQAAVGNPLFIGL